MFKRSEDVLYTSKLRAMVNERVNVAVAAEVEPITRAKIKEMARADRS